MVPLQILPKPQLFDLVIERKPYLIDILYILMYLQHISILPNLIFTTVTENNSTESLKCL